jgi:hypothetical protein
MKRSPVLLLAALILLPSGASAQVVQGRLMGRETEAPVSGGMVQLMADSQSVARALTDSTGRFSLQAPRPGSYWLLGSAPGYQTSETDAFNVGPGGARVTFVIGPPMIGLDTVTATVTGREDRLWYGGFHQRMSENRGGRFITRQQIERQRHMQLQDVLRQVPSLEVQVGARSDFSDSRLMRVRLRQALSFRECWSIFYLNGMRVESEAVQNLNPAEIEGIEIYTHGDVPAQFNSSMGATCGVIVIWTTVR